MDRGDREEGARAFLIARGAREIAHPGGTLYEHLERTAATLRAWEAPADLVLAGLCHASYGTDGFATALIEASQREVLRAIAGDEAEALVYLYASCDRHFGVENLARNPQLFRNRFTGSVYEAPLHMLRDFIQLTFANELDVADHASDPKLRAGIEAYLRTQRSLASKTAWQAFADRFGVSALDGDA
jgi:hypothetical protein